MFRVLTLNLNYRVERHGPWPARRERILAEIRRTQPHVIALQAVEQGAPGDNQAEELARALPGYVYVWFEPVLSLAGGAAKGMAFVGRVPFERHGVCPLSHRDDIDDRDPRRVLRVHCAPGGGIDIYNAHFSWVKGQAESNLREALPFINESRAPALLLGDFNQAPDSAVHESLRAAGWADAWPWLRGAEPGATFEAGAPTRRIDYAYANAPLVGRLSAIDLVGVDCVAPPRLSDHLGLLVTLTLG